MRKLLAFIFLLVALQASSQRRDLRDTLYHLEDRIMRGEKNALIEMAGYLGDSSFVQEFLGYHNYPNTANGVADRIISENVLFTPEEINIDSLKKSTVLPLVQNTAMVFDELAGAFVLTPLTKRNIAYELRGLTSSELKQIDKVVIQSPFPGWYYENQIDGFLLNKDPQALKWIASAWFRRRSRFNRYHANDEEFLNLMKQLTHLEVGVPDEDGKTTFLYKDDYYANARLNYLLYWVNHYEDYRWNNKENFFENIRDKAVAKSAEEILFGFLGDPEDSVAVSAFSKLCEMDTATVIRLADEYERNNIRANYALPTFPYRFLKQVVRLTRYCRDHKIAYKPTAKLLASLEDIEKTNNVAQRYKLENEILSRLTISDITAVEYFGLLNESSFRSTYSIGRILDVFYSEKLSLIASDPSQLALYLKKAALFKNIGIIGTCNKYLKKFQYVTPDMLAQIKKLSGDTTDPDIQKSAGIVISLYPVERIPFREGAGDEIIAGVKNFEKSLADAMKECEKPRHDCGWIAAEVIGKINYAQLGDVMRVLRKDSIFTTDELVSIIQNDFGVDAPSLDEFLHQYDSKNQYQLYEYFFRKSGLPGLDMTGKLLFPQIYRVLKYDIVDGFVGGGGGRRDDGIYPLIKLLELHFKTTLGFGEKLCTSGHPNMICGVTERARAWMQYLEDNKLVVVDKQEPPSIAD